MGRDAFRCEVHEGLLSAVVSLFGELDITTAPEAERCVDACLRRGRRDLTLDLRGVTFLDSTGLLLIVKTDAAARRDGFGFRVVKGPRKVQRVFVLTGMTDRVAFVDSPDESD